MAVAHNPFTCDACGKDRSKDTNHWFLLWRAEFVDTTQLRSLVIEPWDNERALLESFKHACGVSCALRLTERFLTRKTLD